MTQSQSPSQPDAPVPGRSHGSASGAQFLLDRAPPEDYLREWTERIASAKKAADADTSSALIFRIGVEWLALPTQIFQQVADQCPVHSLPHRMDGIVRGVVNIRGELLVCVSLGTVLGIDSEPATVREAGCRVYPRLLVANRSGNRLAFPVDEVVGVHRYHPAILRPVPHTLAESRVSYTLGLIPWRDRTVGCLDDELLFYTLNRSLS